MCVEGSYSTTVKKGVRCGGSTNDVLFSDMERDLLQGSGAVGPRAKAVETQN